MGGLAQLRATFLPLKTACRQHSVNQGDASAFLRHREHPGRATRRGSACARQGAPQKKPKFGASLGNQLRATEFWLGIPLRGTEMNPTSSGSILMNEAALARLEAALRAQRENLRSARIQPSLSPEENHRTPTGSLSPLPECGPIDLPQFLHRAGKSAFD
jgi:hypothetical protein